MCKSSAQYVKACMRKVRKRADGDPDGRRVGRKETRTDGHSEEGRIKRGTEPGVRKLPAGMPHPSQMLHETSLNSVKVKFGTVDKSVQESGTLVSTIGAYTSPL